MGRNFHHLKHVNCCYYSADQWQCVQLLIENGANLNISDCHYGTPLHTAGTLGFTHSAELLLKAGYYHFIK